MEPLPSEPVTSQPKSLIVPIGVCALIAALIAGGGVYSYQNNQLLKKQADLQTQINSLKQQVSIVKTSTPTSASVTLQAIKNMNYVISDSQTVTLKDGIADFVVSSGTGKDGQPSTMTGHVWLQSEKQVAFADLNGDGSQDAVVALSVNYGGTLTGLISYLVMGGNSSLAAIPLSKPGYGDRDHLNFLTIESGVISYDMMVHGPNDGLCCPSLHRIDHFIYQKNNTLTPVN